MEERCYPIVSISRLRMGTDGEGIRTLILTAGCPLRCKYCVNPETWNGSGKREMLTAKEIYGRIRKDLPYMLATCGGITFGGGEPLLYPELICDMRSVCDPQLTIMAETSLQVSRHALEMTMPVIDLYYVDIKTIDPTIYHEYTGGDLDKAMDNLHYLIDRKGADHVVVRIPEIPGFTDQNDQNVYQGILKLRGVKRFDLFKYYLTP